MCKVCFSSFFCSLTAPILIHFHYIEKKERYNFFFGGGGGDMKERHGGLNQHKSEKIMTEGSFLGEVIL